MVSTRGAKYKFGIGEKVLCYEPDPTKAKVLYDSKVMEVVEAKDKKGRRVIEYLIHFQGWNSSWDRTVLEDFVLKDTDKNRQLQRDLAEKSQLQIGAYLYRKERKKRKRILSGSSAMDAKTSFRTSSDDGSSCCSTAAGGVATDESDFMDVSAHHMDHESESCSSSAESFNEDDRVALQISDSLKQFLEYDFKMITKQSKLVNLPAEISVVTILENFVKYFSIKSICGPIGGAGSIAVDGPRRRNSSAKTEKREKDYDKIKTNVNLRKEVADGLRIYFNFLLKDYLLYKQELDQASLLLSTENLKNFTYIGSEKQSLDVMLALKQGTQISISDSCDAHLSNTVTFESSPNEEPAAKRRLRSHKNTEESEFIFDLGAVTASSVKTAESIGSNSSADSSNPTTQVMQMSSLCLLRNLLPVNMAVTSKTRELLQNILSWQILPSDAPAEPSMIYGSVHLSRLVVKLPDFLNATTMTDEKLKLLLQYLDCFIEFLETHKEWFGEHQYKDDIKMEDQIFSCPSPILQSADGS